jgi:DNA-binding transcriptional LysR family regulator
VSRICDDPAWNPNTDISSLRCAAVIGVEADMEMHEIKYFLAACRTLNFHRAAELSHVSQPALTRAVQKLEAELGAHLFHRERNQIRVTDFGRLMRSHLEQVLRETDTAKVAARSFLKLEAAPLALGVMCTIGPLRFVGFLNDFREQHPGIEVSVIENVPGRLSELLLGGTLDIALMAQPTPFDARLNVAPIFRERFGLAFPVGHRFEQRNTLHVTDVRGENYLSRINCDPACLSQRAGGLDHGYGRRRNGNLLLARILGGSPRRSTSTRRGARGGSGGLARLRCGPHILPRRFGIRQSRP